MRPRRLRAVQWVTILFANLGRSRTFGLAGEMAFWLFLSLLPLAAVAGLVVARFAMSQSDVARSLLSTLPPAARDLLTNELARVSAWNGGAVAPLAALTFVWLASTGVHAVFDGLELETEAEPRPWWRKRLLSIVACLGLSVGTALVALLGTGFSWIETLAEGRLDVPVPSEASVLVRTIAAVVLAIALVSALYWIGLPPRARKRMPVLPGALLAVVLQAALGYGYGAYVRRMGDSGAYQAGLAAIGVTMMALYLFSVALLVGIELNQLLGARRLLAASVHPAVVPPPPITEGMVRCEEDPPTLAERVRARFGASQRARTSRA